ncbi:MAG TPA: hydrogenase maturation protease [Spirochaetota bacterium]|nr:hydrogenase maturation protease [Spirochaetota bacterium]HPJ35788.1 hydrogenase maturation protease [Spirochaetota bacterium]
MRNSAKHIYIIGYGNRNRQDDSLGAKLAARLKKDCISGVTVVEKHQLSIEDAYDIAMSGADVVFFIDAAIYGEEPFGFNVVEPSNKKAIALSLFTPETLIYYCEKAFDRRIRGYILGIKGYQWEFSREISDEGFGNSEKAYEFIKDILDILLINSFTFYNGNESACCIK